MRAIFLDFDGVLHDLRAAACVSAQMSVEQVRRDCPRAFSHAAVLAQVLGDAPDVRIVVTSAWRGFFPDDALPHLVPELAPWFGGSLAPGPRAAMIRAWAAEHDVRTFLVLDAEPEHYVVTEWPQLVVCNPVLGVMDSRVVERTMGWLRASLVRPTPPGCQGVDRRVRRDDDTQPQERVAD